MHAAWEPMFVYVYRFTVAVARSVIRAGPGGESTDRQFGMLLIQNADVFLDTLNSVLFQIFSCPELQPELLVEVCVKSRKVILTACEQLRLYANTEADTNVNNGVVRMSSLLIFKADEVRMEDTVDCKLV